MSNLDIINAVDVTRLTPEHVTKEQYTAMYNYALTNGKLRGRNALLIHVMWYTAARISDILSLTPSDMDFKNMVITITIKKSRRTMKTGMKTNPKVMVLPLSPELAIEIMRYVQDRHIEPRDRIFDITRQDAWHIIRSIGMKSLNISIHPHMFRHGAAMQLIASGRHTYEVQAWLGHSSPQITFNTYARITPDMLRDAAKGAGLE